MLIILRFNFTLLNYQITKLTNLCFSLSVNCCQQFVINKHFLLQSIRSLVIVFTPFRPECSFKMYCSQEYTDEEISQLPRAILKRANSLEDCSTPPQVCINLSSCNYHLSFHQDTILYVVIPLCHIPARCMITFPCLYCKPLVRQGLIFHILLVSATLLAVPKQACFDYRFTS